MEQPIVDALGADLDAVTAQLDEWSATCVAAGRSRRTSSSALPADIRADPAHATRRGRRRADRRRR